MLQYGFCYPDNIYDTFEFCIKLDIPFGTTSIGKLIDLTNEYMNSQTILLKHGKLNLVLMAVLRSMLK